MRLAMTALSLLVSMPAFAGEADEQEKAKPEATAKADKQVKKPLLRICTGSKGNTYFRAGSMLAELLKETVEVEVVETKGSWENLERIDAQPRRCDAVLAQDDAYALYQFEKPKSSLTIDRMAALYPEHVHLLCNEKVDIDSVGELDPDKHRVLYNEYGSGTYITWSLFGKLNRKYTKLKSSEVTVAEGLLKVADGVQAQCIVFVSGLGGKTLRDAHDRLGKQLKLVAVRDKRLHRKVGREKRRVYDASTIPEGTYPNLAGDDVKTVSVQAVFFASPEWKARNPEGARALAKALFELVPELEKSLK